MSATITRGATVLSPTLVLGYESSRRSGNIVHKILGREDPDVTFAPAGLRTGTLRIFCLDQTDAIATEALHTEVGVFVLADPEVAGIDMSYVPSGDIRSRLDDRTVTRWVVEIDYQEVAP
ncbi:MAG: hypothetical protein JWP85_994 [Rhodoglobus sp.]|nr:hypothetical protein [Rhodoglobus sp.]